MIFYLPRPVGGFTAPALFYWGFSRQAYCCLASAENYSTVGCKGIPKLFSGGFLSAISCNESGLESTPLLGKPVPYGLKRS